MSEPIQHFEDIENECKAIHDDGHFSNPVVMKATTNIMLIVNRIKGILLNKEKETKNVGND